MIFVEKQKDLASPIHWLGGIQDDYLYPSGATGDEFFKHLIKNDSFLASKCPKCSKTYFPARIYCEDCSCDIPKDEWFEIPATGTIKHHIAVSVDNYGKILKEPRIIAMIKIDNADGAMLGVIKTNNLEEELIGKQVKAVFKPKNKRDGTLKDILYFTKK